MAHTFSLESFLKRFDTNDACLKEIVKMRFPKGIRCPHCEKVQKFYRVSGRTAYSCGVCRGQVHPLAGTIFEKTTTPLRLWFYAMFLMIHTRSGISAKQLERELGVTYKTAWRMFKKIRTLMGQEEQTQLSGVVEIDEAFFVGRGGQWSNTPKEVLFGMVQRGGHVRLRHIPNIGRHTLLREIEKNVQSGTHIMTDQYPGYADLSREGYPHKTVNHSKQEWTRDDVYVQTIEAIWCTMKCGVKGVYRHISKKHLQTYANEYAFRYNHRKEPERMFNVLLSQLSLG